MDFKNVAATVTGGGSGLGAATARLLAHRGARVAILDQNIEAATNVAKEIDGVAFKCNVADPGEVEGSLDQAALKQGPSRILVNCAGIGEAARAVNKHGAAPLDGFIRVVNVNLIGTFNVIRLFAERCMKLDPVEDDERGVIVNTASIAAYDGQIGQAAYSASKGGVVSMTLPLAREFAKFGIRVNSIAPGIFGTPLFYSSPEQVQKQITSLIPFPHRLGKAEEFGKLVVHICENNMLNGETIRIDGSVRLS